MSVHEDPGRRTSDDPVVAQTLALSPDTQRYGEFIARTPGATPSFRNGILLFRGKAGDLIGQKRNVEDQNRVDLQMSVNGEILGGATEQDARTLDQIATMALDPEQIAIARMMARDFRPLMEHIIVQGRDLEARLRAAEKA